MQRNFKPRLTTLRRVENARREARQVCSNVKITGTRGIFCSVRSPGGRAGRRKNCEKNPANCAAAVVSRARRRLSMRGAAYSAGRAVQEVGQEAGKIASKIRQTAQPLCFRARAQAFQHGCLDIRRKTRR